MSAYTYKGFHVLAEASAMDNYEIDEVGMGIQQNPERGVTNDH